MVFRPFTEETMISQGHAFPWNISLTPTQPTKLLFCFVSTSLSPGLEPSNFKYD